MILDLKRDNEGLLYTDNNTNMVKRYLSIDKRNRNEYYASDFYSIPGTNDYIIKRPISLLNKTTRLEYKNMLVKLLEKQPLITKTEFPVGYYREKKKLEGLIVRYYAHDLFCTSLDLIKEKPEFNRTSNKVSLVRQYYDHDNDDLHNFFLIFSELLEALEEMFINGIYYFDVNPGNIILYHNGVRIIDFNPSRIWFDHEDVSLKAIMDRYIELLNIMVYDYELCDFIDEKANNFHEAKSLTKHIEELSRRNR